VLARLKRLPLIRDRETLRSAHDAAQTPWLLAQAWGRRARAIGSSAPRRLVSLGSQTVDRDDLAIARACLADATLRDDLQPLADFEQAFAAWNGSRTARAFASGRVALSACLDALLLRPGDEALVPGYTCVAVPNAFAFAGVPIRFVDIELDTYGLDVADLARKITPQSRVVLLHHLFGLVCRDYEAIVALARERGLHVIEDCAHATGAEFRGTKVGRLGDVAFYSSEQSKIFSTGNGGLAVTDDPVLGARLDDIASAAPTAAASRQRRLLRTFITNYYTQSAHEPGALADWHRIVHRAAQLESTTRAEERGQRPGDYGERLTPALARIGLRQLAKLDALNARRRHAAAYWRSHPALQAFGHPMVPAESTPVYVRYPILVPPERKRQLTWMRDLGVVPGDWFVSNVHPARRTVPECPVADDAVARCVNLPTLLPEMP
jgi:perosamine synthetase